MGGLKIEGLLYMLLTVFTYILLTHSTNLFFVVVCPKLTEIRNCILILPIYSRGTHSTDNKFTYKLFSMQNELSIRHI